MTHSAPLPPADPTRGSRLRIAAWSGAALLLLLPLIAMQVTDEVNWTVGDFVFAAVLILSVGIPLELVVRKTRDLTYRSAAGLALAGAFLLTWVNAAVGLTDSDADGLYLVVVAVGLVGAIVARFRPDGMARVLFAMALAVALTGVVALIAGVVPAHNSVFQILAISVFFAVPFVGSAVLFQQAARERRERDVR